MGNKRVAAAITEAFLETNGCELTMSNDEMVVLFLAIASSELVVRKLNSGCGKE